MQETINKQQTKLNEQDRFLREVQIMMKNKDKELERCKEEGDGMREEVSSFAALIKRLPLPAGIVISSPVC